MHILKQMYWKLQGIQMEFRRDNLLELMPQLDLSREGSQIGTPCPVCPPRHAQCWKWTDKRKPSPQRDTSERTKIRLLRGYPPYRYRRSGFFGQSE